MASSNPDISSVIKPDPDIEKNSKEIDVDSSSNYQHSSIRNFATAFSQQAANDTTSSLLFNDIPQWKKDLIQRRKINTTKTSISASFDTNATKGTPVLAGSLSPNSDLKHSLPIKKTFNNYEKPVIHAFNVNTPNDTNIFTSQQNTSNNNNLTIPATLEQRESESSSCGVHYTQAINSSGSSYNHNDKLVTRTFIKQKEQSTVSEARSLGMTEYISADSSATSAQENAYARLRKNPTQQHEPTNTIIFDSFTTSTSRLSSGIKVSTIQANNSKKSDKDHLNVCVGEQQAHTIQEPALIPVVTNNNNKSRSVSDDDPQLQHQLNIEHESGSSAACVSVNKSSVKEIELKAYLKNNDLSGIKACSPTNLLSKKTCGIVNAPCRSPTAISSQFIKNPNVNNSNLVSTHHNYKINTKLRSSQNTSPPNTTISTILASPVIESATLVTNNKKKMVAAQEMNEVITNELDFDSSEELQYGPGIVSKLRCRYLSLALRQSMDKQRLSVDTLRRATSLNNLLDDNDVNDEDDDDDDDDEHFIENNNKETTSLTSVCNQKNKNIVTVVKSNEKRVNSETNTEAQSGEKATSLAPTHSYQYRSRNIKRGNDSLKRARSVEALLSEKSSWHFSNSQPLSVKNTKMDLISIEDKITNARGRLLLGIDNSPKRLSSIIDDTERPPPDLVKQTLKKFEATANRRYRAINRSVSGEVAMKVANYKSIITQNKPAIAFPKPPISPKKSNLKKLPNELKNNISALPTTQNMIALLRTENNNNAPAIVNNTPEICRQKVDLKPIKTPVCMGNIERLSEYSPDIIPRHKLIDKTLLTSIAADSPVSDLTKKNESLCVEPLETTHIAQQQPSSQEIQGKFSAEFSDHDSDDDDSIDGEYVVNSEDNHSIKQISKSALENIARAGTSQHFLFKTKPSSLKCNFEANSKTTEPPLHDIPTLPLAGITTVKQIGIIKPLFTESRSDSECPVKHTERNLRTQSASILTSREIEKNRINNEKRNEKENTTSMDQFKSSGSVKEQKKVPSELMGKEEAEILPAAMWSSAIALKKKLNPSGNTPENNTMVFNFKDRKEVPDYIENDGLILKRKRELPKPNEPGFVLLGDLSLETSTDPEDEWPMCPPSPCDVEFENANIVIDGKSSIKNRLKDANIRVQFNDTLTSTFEYPSESSLIDESCSEILNVNTDALDTSQSIAGNRLHHTSSQAVHHHIIVEEIIQLPQSNKPLGNLSLGSAPLNNYTPVKAKMDSTFQLGVTRVPNPSDKSEDSVHSEERVQEVCREQLQSSSLDYLKPATDDLTIAYSEGSLETDLLY